MGTEPVNYEAVIADLEAKKAHLETMIAGLRALSGMSNLGVPPSGGPGGHPGPGGKIPHDAFLNRSIPEAAKIHLGNVRKKLSTQEVMEALEAGGLPGSKYQTVYAILSRRENKVGDIVNIKGDWALAEWYPNYTKKPAKKGATAETAGEGDTLEELLEDAAEGTATA